MKSEEIIHQKSKQMKNFVLGFLLFLVSYSLHSQVGINTTNPNAQLDIRASNQTTPGNNDGLLIPKVDAFPVINPTAAQNGMLVFLTTENKFYFWDNNTTSWVAIVDLLSSVKKINDLSDAKSDNDGSNDGSSVFLGLNAGATDDGTDNGNVGCWFSITIL